MQCPECQSTHIRKNGKRKGKQSHICVNCGRQFIEHYEPPQGYSDKPKLKNPSHGDCRKRIELSNMSYTLI